MTAMIAAVTWADVMTVAVLLMVGACAWALLKMERAETVDRHLDRTLRAARYRDETPDVADAFIGSEPERRVS